MGGTASGGGAGRECCEPLVDVVDVNQLVERINGAAGMQSCGRMQSYDRMQSYGRMYVFGFQSTCHMCPHSLVLVYMRPAYYCASAC